MAITCILMVKVQIFSLPFYHIPKGRFRYRSYNDFLITITISRVGDMLKAILAGAF